jgi:hypothetical protein
MLVESTWGSHLTSTKIVVGPAFATDNLATVEKRHRNKRRGGIFDPMDYSIGISEKPCLKREPFWEL